MYPRSLTYKKGDRKPDCVLYVQVDEKGTLQDLTLASSAAFYLRNSETGALKVSAGGTSLGGAAGTITYAWGATDLDTTGRYEAYAIIQWPGSLPMTTTAVEVLVKEPWEVME